jgi:hypothetical protein
MLDRSRQVSRVGEYAEKSGMTPAIPLLLLLSSSPGKGSAPRQPGGGNAGDDPPLKDRTQDQRRQIRDHRRHRDSALLVVALPAYFEALNRDFRYQLTVIGQFAQAIVAEEISKNQFTIKTDQPNVKVSWQVTGIRQDAFADAHRIVVEQDKPASERGTYLHPAEHGQPASIAVDYERQAAALALFTAASWPLLRVGAGHDQML